jgi:BirA family transcriptional regulator, biotin operon repressor / biotin---[acetyl-CoA-carboxylase] ligase
MIYADAPLVLFDEIDSTNEEARRRAACGDIAPALIVARRQTAGRGRRGRSWSSNADGNLFMTYFGPAEAAPAELALLGFGAGLALIEECEALTGSRDFRLKWPNDLLFCGRKAAGVLLETGPRVGAGGQWIALGIGCNLASAPEDAGQPAATIAEVLSRPVPAPETFALQVLVRLSHWASMLRASGFAPLRSAWLDRAYGLGEPIRVAESSLEGRMAGISPRGELELVMPGGDVRLISAGDVFFPASRV